MAADRTDVASATVGFLAALGAAAAVGWLLGRRAQPIAFVLVGGLAGLIAGALLFAITESLTNSSGKTVEVLESSLRAAVLGSFWAAPIAIPVGATFGLMVLVLGKVIGVVEPAFTFEPPYLRGAVIAVVLSAEAVATVALHAWGT
jgi:hypothetical protein